MGVTVCVCVHNMLGYPSGGGHWWVFLNWMLGLHALGCRVICLDEAAPNPTEAEFRGVAALRTCLERLGLPGSLALVTPAGEPAAGDLGEDILDLDAAAEADLLLNFRYGAPPATIRRFRRTALVDIDPGLLQIWISSGQLAVSPHDIYFTTGETVGAPGARFPDCGIAWHHTPPPVFLPAWPPAPAGSHAPYTTVSQWWDEDSWVKLNGKTYCNDKRTSFLEFLDLPSRTPSRLELALGLGRSPIEETERQELERRGWSIRHAGDVAPTPEQYREYVQRSRGEFSCAKPSCMRLQNAWISDRTLCYLASAKPAVVQWTGRSRFLPDAEGLFRFQTLEDAARALSAAESDYERHCRAARRLVEEHFDATKVVKGVLERALA